MSVVTSAVIVVSYAPREVEAKLTEPQMFGRTFPAGGQPGQPVPVELGYAQAFKRIGDYCAGGGKALQCDVYAAGLNHIGPDELREWFLALPWGKHGAAVLIFDIEGFSRTVVCTPAWDAP